MSPQPLPWCEPLALARSLGNGAMVLLHSSARARYSGGLSLLAYDLLESVDIKNFNQITTLSARPHTRWFGYLSYEMKHDCEHYTSASQPGANLPHGRLMRFSQVYIFDHVQQELMLWSDEKISLPPLQTLADIQPPTITSLTSNMSRQEYEQKVAKIIEEIHQGNLYQANLTRKFYGQWENTPDGLALFARMCRETPAPYSAYLRMEDAEVLSSSPELFLKIDEQGHICTRPIKGTAPRGKDEAEDAALRQALEQSPKNRAENLMITDLMRSDLSKVCMRGSVKVADLFDVTAHATIFHMASSISGKRARGKTIGDILRATFPPGSMTGAPKIRAVELCNALEGNPRGLYSGAIGWFDSDGSAELSVVIRTLIVHKDRFEFQVGGGIVADSTPAGEWQEIMDKALGILKTLNISQDSITSI